MTFFQFNYFWIRIRMQESQMNAVPRHCLSHSLLNKRSPEGPAHRHRCERRAPAPGRSCWRPAGRRWAERRPAPGRTGRRCEKDRRRPSARPPTGPGRSGPPPGGRRGTADSPKVSLPPQARSCQWASFSHPDDTHTTTNIHTHKELYAFRGLKTF